MNKKVSILITNFNKEKFLKKSLESVFRQTYKNYEIILFDDCSTDKSLEIIKKFKKIILIKNSKKKHKSAPLNQINGVLKLFVKSKGKIVCLMDSDDQFINNKLEHINKEFDENKNLKCIFNLVKNSNSQFTYRNKKNKLIWPSIFPTSCISFSRKFFKEFKKYIKKNEYPNLEIDARITIFSNFFFNEYNIFKKKLTFYSTDISGINYNMKKYSPGWWLRRYEAYQYLQYILKIKKKKFIPTFDYYVTCFFVFVTKIIR